MSRSQVCSSFFKINSNNSYQLLSRYFVIYKPYLVLSQFSQPSTDSGLQPKRTLKQFFDVPSDVYPVGRLDYDSEGLLILTNDSTLNYKLLHPSHHHEREYLIQVEGTITQDAINNLTTGVTITVDGKSYRTHASDVRIRQDEVIVPPRDPPIRFRKEIPTSWMSLSLTEGKNRQVRKMTAATGFPTLRLIRVRIEQLMLADLQPGEIKELSRKDIYTRLRLNTN